MKKMTWVLVGLAILSLAAWGCRESPSNDADAVPEVGGETGDEDVLVNPQEITGNERWLQPAGSAAITFFVDDRANATFADAEMKWTGSFKWNAEDNSIEWAASWLPTDGPYPLLYDDGPISQGGHEMRGAEAGDHIFSTEVYYKAAEDKTFDYGVLNELDFWMWKGANGAFTVPKGSTALINAEGLVLDKFGAVDFKITVDTTALLQTEPFSEIPTWGGVNVYVKGSMNMWAPLQVLDSGPDGGKGDAVAGDGVFTFVQGLNPGKHTGLLFDGQHAQFAIMFAKPEETYATAIEYKVLTEGTMTGAAEGVSAFVSCAGGGVFSPAEITWEMDSWGSTLNTTVVVDCGGVTPPECTEADDTCGAGTKCIDGKCKPWCDGDEECTPPQLCLAHQCKDGCLTDEDCEGGLKCIGNLCKEWCETNEDCADGQACTGNKCVDEVPTSAPKVSSVVPDSGPTTGGTLVTVNGSGFMDGASVTFDSVPATGVVVVSSGAIECVTPPHTAWKVDVAVTNPDGGTDNFIKAFNYVEQTLAPQIDSLDPKEGPLTGGTTVNVYGSNFLPSPTVMFGATVAASVQFIDSTHVVAVTPSGALGPVDVTVVNSDSQQDVLAGGFTYVPNLVDYAKLLAPAGLVGLEGQETEEIFAEVWEPGVTPGFGPGAGLSVQAGFGPEGVNPALAPEKWTFTDAVFAAESGNNDVWKATLTPAAAGAYWFTFRFSLDGKNWVYADFGGNLDGFQPDDMGTLSVVKLGEGPVVLGVVPKYGTAMGGYNVSVVGAGFVEGATVTVGGTPIAGAAVMPDEISFLMPKHAVGLADVEVKNPDGKVGKKAAGFEFVPRFTPSLDGELSDWDDVLLAASNSIESTWDPEKNALHDVYVAYDKGNLYVAVRGTCEALNYILGYVDTDYGQASGVSNMVGLSDNGGNGDLDDALSNVLNVTAAGFGAELAFGTRGMESYLAGSLLDSAKYAGWRWLSPVDNLPWISATVMCTASELEAAIGLDEALGGEIPENGRQVAVVVKLTNNYGGFEGMSNQTLPEYFDPQAVSVADKVVVVSIRP